MRSRVAFIVTLVSLVVLAALFSYNCTMIADETNEDLRVQTRNFCTNISSITSEYTPEQRVEALKKVFGGRRIVVGLYDAEGKAVYVSDEAYNTLSKEEMDVAQVGKTVQDEQKDANGNTVIFAIYRYEDGAFLVFEGAEANLWSTLREKPSLILMVAVFGLCMVAFLIVLSYMLRRERYLNSV